MQTQPRSFEEHLKAWSRVEAETERTSELLADLLTLARADAGKAEMEFSSMDLAEVVRLAVDEMRVMVEAKGLHLETVVDGPSLIIETRTPFGGPSVSYWTTR